LLRGCVEKVMDPACSFGARRGGAVKEEQHGATESQTASHFRARAT
jgi:hypothetical protein